MNDWFDGGYYAYATGDPQVDFPGELLWSNGTTLTFEHHLPAGEYITIADHSDDYYNGDYIQIAEGVPPQFENADGAQLHYS